MARKKIKIATDQRQFTMVYNDFLESEVLKSDEKMLFIVLKRFADDKGRCFPSLSKLASVMGVSKRKVQDLINSLEEKGIISKEKRNREDGGTSSNLYNIYDYAGMWGIKKCEDNKKISDEMEDARMIGVLIEKGYTVTKGKELVSAPTKEQKQAPKKSNLCNKDNTKVEKSQERYTLEQVKVFYDYEIMVNDRPLCKNNIDAVINILYDTLNTTKKTIRVQGESKPATAVIAKLMKLNHEDVFYVIDKFQEQTERIRSPKSYMLTLLYNAKEQMHLDIVNQVQHDMYNGSSKTK